MSMLCDDCAGLQATFTCNGSSWSLKVSHFTLRTWTLQHISHLYVLKCLEAVRITMPHEEPTQFIRVKSVWYLLIRTLQWYSACCKVLVVTEHCQKCCAKRTPAWMQKPSTTRSRKATVVRQKHWFQQVRILSAINTKGQALCTLNMLGCQTKPCIQSNFKCCRGALCEFHRRTGYPCMPAGP